jgi:hypothetical protein
MAYSNIPNGDFTNTPLRVLGDAGFGSAGGLTLAGVITGWAGAVAAVLTVAWFAYQIYDLWERRKKRKQTAKRRKK